MNKEKQSKIDIRLFVGFYLPKDLLYELHNNLDWKLSRVALKDEDLIEVHEEKQAYIGIYLKENIVTYDSLKQTEEQLKMMLKHYLPNSNDLHLEIFSKLFVL